MAPDGQGLPAGCGTAAAGAEVYASECAACHGENSRASRTTAAPGRRRPLVGGRGTLTTDKPLMTVGSYWQYATTLWSYIAPGACRYDDAGSPHGRPGICGDRLPPLTSNGIIGERGRMDATTLPTGQDAEPRRLRPRPRPEPVDYD